MLQFHDLDLSDLRVLLCDADGNLFPSEEPAFVASTTVTNVLLEAYDVSDRVESEQLRLATTGKNFRTTAVDLLAAHGVAPDAEELEHWVAEEKRVVSAYLGQVLRPDPDVLDPLGKLAPHVVLAAVSSSATTRLAACFAATGLDALLPPERRFSAEDSLPVPTSKPDPAVYLHAGRQLGCAGRQGLAVEDSLPGALSAVAAGFPTVGNVAFVPEAERAERVEVLRAAGVAAVISSWRELADLLLPAVGRP